MPPSVSARLRRFCLILGLGAATVACGPKQVGDPAKVSRSEYDLATDLWTRQREPRQALEHALRAAELDRDNADAAHLVSLIYLDFCQNSRIGECRLSDAEHYARRAIRAQADLLPAQNTLAVILVHQKRYDEAIAILKPITTNILYGTPEIAWGNLGWAYLEKGDLTRAISALNRAVAAEPLFCVGNYRLGCAYHRAGQLASARDSLDRALETPAPGCAALQDAYFERAQVHLELGEREQARADYDRCISLDRRSRTGERCSTLLGALD